MTTDAKQETKSETLPILINLDEERDAYIVNKPANMVHMQALSLIKDRISESLDFAKKYSTDRQKSGSTLIRVRRHDTIMLAGVRGSGKTTFMLSLLNFIENQLSGAEEYHFGGEIASLHILDPTLIEDKTHIFINIISMIKEKVDEKAKKSNCFSDDKSEVSGKYKEWEKSFRKLAEGLPAINGVGSDGFSTESWLDAEYIMDKGVRMAQAANTLEKAFHCFVHQSLEFIGKKAFILCFDDIDTSFKRGWPVLEVLHKYLTTPQIITILSGDPALYSILIKDQQWTNFSDRLLDMETKSDGGREKYRETVAHLEEQYFLKLLKPERRIFLNSLYQKELQKDTIKVQWKENEEGTSLKDSYKLILEAYGIYRAGEQEAFYQFLASTPLRTQKQLLYGYNASLKQSGKDFGNSIIDVFWTDLSEKNVDVSNLRNIPHYTVPQVVDYLVKNKILIEGYTLTPLFSDHFINAAQFALGTLIADRIKNDPAQIFEYWLRVCLTRELGTLMEAQVAEKGKGPSVEDFVDYCSITKLKASRYLSRISTAYIRACLGNLADKKIFGSKVTDDKGAWHGTLPLKGLSEKAKKYNTNDRIDAVFTKEEGFLKVMAYLPLSGFTNHKGESRPVYSFYNLLGVLGELVFTIRSAGANAEFEVKKVIAKCAQYREYALPSWASPISDSQGNTPDFIDDDNPDDSLVEQVDSDFTKELIAWVHNYKSEHPVSPSLLGKIFTRFYYSINKMDSKLASDVGLGNWMHRLTVAFLNSVLLVEAMERLELFKEKKKGEISVKLTNPTSKDDNFIINLKAINSIHGKETLTFSKWILSCPIWNFYLKSEFYSKYTDGFDALLVFTGTNKSKPKYPRELNAKLDDITVYTYDHKQNAAPDQKRPTNNKLNFSIDEDGCREDFENACHSTNNKREDIIGMGKDGILRFILEHLSPKYKNGLTITNAKYILKRVGDGIWLK